jgi:hypothetical protein
MSRSNPYITSLRYNKNDPRLAEINETRQKSGLPPVEQKTRNCLLCDKEFLSTGAGDRRCERCRNSKKVKSRSHDII